MWHITSNIPLGVTFTKSDFKWYLIIDYQNYPSANMTKTRFIFPFIFFIFSKTFNLISDKWQNRQEVCFDMTGHIFASWNCYCISPRNPIQTTLTSKHGMFFVNILYSTFLKIECSTNCIIHGVTCELIDQQSVWFD